MHNITLYYNDCMITGPQHVRKDKVVKQANGLFEFPKYKKKKNGLFDKFFKKPLIGKMTAQMRNITLFYNELHDHVFITCVKR